ncbi:SDR family oxidoreductase [Streptomyces genisteinicus]|uniref:SDR family oxidoreductase n=1 Tax=Streptomyces genisteinicus TaxID=2768068 RepID=A0A7H0HM67_9ACTN|nr:SDR family oxidoreductase [Streptomyces genisteinicus]QNP61633.1 SDR family oxidoreductase [Streptomyces genisteinicus]
MDDGLPQRRVAVVTGAARGIGAALSRELAARGLRVALLGREVDALRAVAAGLPWDARCFGADVTDRAAMADTADRVAREMGPASVVVANAGIAATGPFADADPDLWERVVDVNLLGSAGTARVFLPHLARTRGYFLQIASTASFGSAPMMSAYCASKAGVESFAQALRAEVAPQGIGVGIAYLHWTRTEMTRDIDEHPVLVALRSSQPRFAARVHPPEEVARQLRRGIARRATSIHCPPWLRLLQPLRPLFPPLVAHVSRRHLKLLDDAELARTSGVLGAGGAADWGARPG